MPTNEHLVLCGGTVGPPGLGARVSLNLHGKSANVHLQITDISERLLANVPDALVDLVEIASYIYAADSAISRGGPADAEMGIRWRRRLRFIIPVRLPNLWSADPVKSALVDTLSFLSEDDYAFEFRALDVVPPVSSYFEFLTSDKNGFIADDVILFSGGLDSLAGAIERIAAMDGGLHWLATGQLPK
jgi:hypothetical protein